MATITIDIPNQTFEKIPTKNTNNYLLRLIEEDFLLTEIKKSKASGEHALTSLDELDD